MATRRHVLQILVSCAAAPSLAGCGPALPDPIAAWREPGAGERDPRRFALAHAILAPNSHNMQPWLIELRGEEEIVLYFDRARRLPQTDPLDRQCTISCGTFLELLSIAAAQKGLRADITGFPEGAHPTALDDRPVAHVRLAAGASPDALYPQIVRRRTHKDRFTGDALSPDELGAVIPNQPDWAPAEGLPIAFNGALSGDPRAEEIRRLAPLAYRREVETPRTLKESIDVIRIGPREIATHRDGIDLDFPGVSAMKAIGFVTREKMLTPGTQAYAQGLAMYDPLAETAAGFVWMTSANDRMTQLQVGRLYARLNLQAAANGVAIHPMSQALQEYPEMAQYRVAMETAVGLPKDMTLQMLARVGRAGVIAPAPRRGLEEHLQ